MTKTEKYIEAIDALIEDYKKRISTLEKMKHDALTGCIPIPFIELPSVRGANDCGIAKKED